MAIRLAPEGVAGQCFLALGDLGTASSAEVRVWLGMRGVMLRPDKVRGSLQWLARKDLPMVEMTARRRDGRGSPGQWRLTKRGRSVYATECADRLP
jgi:hypothetical protein